MSTDYTIRISTPADFSGLQGIKPQLKDVEAGLQRAKAASAAFRQELQAMVADNSLSNFGATLDRQIQSRLAALNVAEDRAKRRTSTAGGGVGRAEMEATRQATEAMSSGAKKADDSGNSIITASAKWMAAGAGFSLATKTIRMGLAEVAEDDGAQQALAKYKLSIEEVAQAGELLETLKFVTGDKISAAQMFGRVMNGNTRGLEQYGIQLSDASTKTERLAAMQRLAAQGAEAQAAAMDTLTGKWSIFTETLGDKVGGFIKWATDAAGLGDGIEALTLKMKGFENRRDWMEQLDRAKEKAERASLALKENARQAEVAQKKLEALGIEAARTARSYDDMAASVQRANAIEAAGKAADVDEEIAAVDEEVASGVITPKEGERQKERIRSSAAVDTAESNVKQQEAKKKAAQEIKDDFDRQAMRASEAAETAPKELRDKAEAQFSQIEERAKEAERQLQEAEAELQIARQKLRSAKAQQSSVAASQTADDTKETLDAAAKRKTEADREAEKKRKESEQDAEKRAEADARVKEKLDEGAKGFTNEFGKGRNASDVLNRARKAAEKRLGGLSPDDATEKADKVFEEEVSKFTKPDGKDGRKLRPGEFRSSADGESGLDRLKGMQGKPNPSGGGNDLSKAAASVGAIDPVLGKMLGLMGTLAGKFKTIQGQLNQLESKMNGLDQSVSK